MVAILAPDTGDDPSAMPGVTGAAIVGVVGLAALATSWFMRRPLDCGSDASLASSYRTRFFFRLATAEGPALVGLTLFFMTANPLMYPWGLAFTVGFVHLTPSAANLARDQDELANAGCPRLLVPALRWGATRDSGERRAL